MTEYAGIRRIRRVVTGNDERGRSKVFWDGPAPSVHPGSMGAGRAHTDFWVWNESPAPLSGSSDDGNLTYDFPGPPKGGHWRVVQGPGKAPDYDAAKDNTIIPPHPSKEHELGRRWDRGGTTAYGGNMHKTETVDYAIVVDGSRTLELDSGKVEWSVGDIVIDVGAWHRWASYTPEGGSVAFDMIAAKFVDGPQGLAQGSSDDVLRPKANQKLPPGVKPARRIVCLDKEPGKSSLASDGPSPDVRIDPARPGFAIQRMWVTDGTPAKIVFESLHLPNVIQPPKDGSVLNVFTFPPDDSWKERVREREVRAYFESVGAPHACTYSREARHPYMQKMSTLDFVIVQEGEIVLVLDNEEVKLNAGDFVVNRGVKHAWSNRASKPAVLAIASHDGRM